MSKAEDIQTILNHLSTLPLSFDPAEQVGRMPDYELRAWALRCRSKIVPDDLQKCIDDSQPQSCPITLCYQKK